MDTLSNALDHMPGPGTDVIARVTEIVDIDVDVPALAADLSDAAVDGLGAAAEVTADASRSLVATIRRHPVLSLVAVGAVVAAVVAWRARNGSGDPAQFELGDG